MDIEISPELVEVMDALVVEHKRWIGRTTHMRSGWRKVESPIPEQDEIGQTWIDTHEPGSVIWTVGAHDGQPWLHVSLSRVTRVPTYKELTWLHKAFIGDRWAYQVFAPMDRHVNIHPFALHLWSPLGVNPLPDFSGEIAGVRTI